MFPCSGCVLLLAWSPPGFDAVCVASANTRQGELCVESVDTAPDHPPVMHQIHHARSSSRSAAVLCPHSTRPRLTDEGSDFTSFTPLRDSVKLCLSGLELEILHNNKSELKPTEVFVPICHW